MHPGKNCGTGCCVGNSVVLLLVAQLFKVGNVGEWGLIYVMVISEKMGVWWLGSQMWSGRWCMWDLLMINLMTKSWNP